MHQCRQWTVSGKVQGVGFRPFVYRLAHQYHLQGWVRNVVGQVEIRAQGELDQLDLFAIDLMAAPPSISAPNISACRDCKLESFDDFQILNSEANKDADIYIPLDYFTCPDCLDDLNNPANRRYHYPFTNCTQCGPRYTLIASLPYDRPQTSMAEFPLCNACLQEYQNPLDRRFHAEPLACSVCGPQLSFRNPHTTINQSPEALTACIHALEQGEIVAVKGVGGYHLMCDTSNDAAILGLRERKHRPHKPLAVMFPAKGDDGLASVQKVVLLTPEQADLLTCPSRPIVLADKRPHSLASLIAPGLGEIGVMLAYSPLHHLLLNAMDKPMVVTSANISGEPVLIDETEVEARLKHITPHFLHHDRPILRPADDSVFRRIGGTMRPIRLGRGHAPTEITLPFKLPQAMLACGSHMKNTIALAWDNRLVVSPHIGDLDSPRSMQVFEQVAADLQCLYQVEAELLVCDAHPQYASTRWALDQALPAVMIQHHQAHASAVALEYWSDEPYLIFSWDGTGYGDDGTIWGGEAFYGRPGSWQRVASMRPFRLPGGDKAGRELWRSAAALCWETDQNWAGVPKGSKALKQAWQRKLNAPQSTAVGRLFDAAAALTGLCHIGSFEGQGPMLLEQASDALWAADPLPITADTDGLLRADWGVVLPELQDKTRSVKERATVFHSRLAHTLLEQVARLSSTHSFTRVGLCGGVFQNQKLTDYLVQQLQQQHYQPCLPKTLPVNDASISAGQIIEAAARQLSPT